jgi:hypothetical protein
MVEKGWTREMVGRLTVNDLRIFAHEHAPSAATGGPAGKITSAAEYRALLERRREAERSWLDS